MQVISGVTKAVDVVRDVNLKVLAPLSLSAETSEGMRELDLTESLVDHGLLGGLGDDDHTIYLLADGTRDVTGDLLFTGTNKLQFRDANQYIYSLAAGLLTFNSANLITFTIGGVGELTLISTGLVVANRLTAQDGFFQIATGSPPLIIASTTVVANLNVDQVDGLDSTDLVLVDGSQGLSADWDAGSFQIRALEFQSDVATGVGPPFIVSSTDLVINLDSDTVDGLHASAFSLTGHNHILAVGATDVTAKFSELNLLDLAGLTAGDVLSADTATTASWKSQTGGSGASLTVLTTQVFSGTSPTSMTNLDLSGTVGSNVAIVALSFKSAADMNALAVRTDGDANEYYAQNADANAYGVQLGHADDAADLVLIVATNSSGIIEWRTEVALTCTVDILWFIA